MAKSYLHRVAAMETLTQRMTENVPANHQHAQKMIDVVVQLKNSVKALGQLYETPDPTVTRAAHDKRVQSAATKLSDQRRSSFQRIQDILQQGMRDIDARIDAKVNLKPNEFAAEIRAMFRNLKPGEQATLLSKLAIGNKGPEIAAIICAPAVLTGISDELQMRYQDQIISIHARAEFEEKKALMDAFQPALVATDVAKDTAADFSDPARLAAIEHGEAAAAAAIAAFNDSTQP
jgi:hypothetical protein